MELTITKEKVLEAASKCETAQKTLMVLFPEAFPEDPYEGYKRDLKSIAEFIGNSISYDLYRGIPATYSSSKDKAKWIIEQILKVNNHAL